MSPAPRTGWSRIPPVVIVAGLVVSPGAAAAQTITIDSGTVYQTMMGWETTARAWEIDKVRDGYNATWLQYAPHVIDRLVNELGVNRVRLEIKSGFENPTDFWSSYVSGAMTYTQWKDHSYEKVNDDNDPNTVNPAGFQFSEFDFHVDSVVVPMKQRLEARGEKLFVNLNYVDFNTGNQGSMSHATAPSEYAEIVKVYADRLRDKYGIRIDNLEIILEPDNTQGWTGARIGQGAAAAGMRLASAGYTFQIAAPSCADPSSALTYLDAVTAVTGATQYLTMLSYHRYGSTDYATLPAAAKARNMMTGMLEFIDGTIDTLYEDLTVAQASAWQKWGLAINTPGNGHYYYEADFANPDAPVIRMENNTALLAQVFRYVRLGARRIGATTAAGQWTALAFVNSNGKQVVVVKTATNAARADATIVGLARGTYGVRTTNFSRVASDLPDVTTATDGKLTVSIPAGVTTIYGISNIGGSGGAAGTGGAGGAAGTGGAASTGGSSAGGGAGGDALGGAAGESGTGGSSNPGDPGAKQGGCSCTIDEHADADAWFLPALLGLAFILRSSHRRRRARTPSSSRGKTNKEIAEHCAGPKFRPTCPPS
jgi:MYXO-CTERM domain-containing protein